MRVWDVFLLEGERVLTCMAFNILKLHRKRLQQLGMDDILQFLQVNCVFILQKEEMLLHVFKFGNKCR